MKEKKIRTRTAHMRACFADPSQKVVKREAILLATGAKAYCLGGGHWLISGYAEGGQDVDYVLAKLGL